MSTTFRELLDKKTLILGDVGAGKTKLTVQILEEATKMGCGKDLTVIDMAPATTMVKGRKVGGKLSEFTKTLTHVRYWTPEKVETPRLKAESAEQLLHLVNLNRERIEPIVQRYITDPSPILLINDISIYFQSGRAELIHLPVKIAKTFIANGYYGTYFAFDYGTDVSKVEKDCMDELAKLMDIVIRF